ncbi:unnamed protein product, partial [Allacma fusca]
LWSIRFIRQAARGFLHNCTYTLLTNPFFGSLPPKTAIMPIEGKYKLTKSENFEEYMKAIGVNMVMRKLAASATPETEISQADGSYKIKTSTTFKTTEINFKLGEPFDEETADGRKCKSTITLDGDTMIHSQDCGGTTYEILRKFTDSDMTMILKHGEVTSTRVYAKP